MPVREDEPVSVGMPRRLRVEPQFVEEQVRQVVRRGEGTPGVPRVRDVGHRHDVAADLPRDLGELGKRLVLSRRHRLVLRWTRGMKARTRSPVKRRPIGRARRRMGASERAGLPRGRKPPRKVRAPQGKVVGNAHRAQAQGKRNREQTADGLEPARARGSGKGETVG